LDGERSQGQNSHEILWNTGLLYEDGETWGVSQNLGALIFISYEKCGLYTFISMNIPLNELINFLNQLMQYLPNPGKATSKAPS